MHSCTSIIATRVRVSISDGTALGVGIWFGGRLTTQNSVRRSSQQSFRRSRQKRRIPRRCSVAQSSLQEEAGGTEKRLATGGHKTGGANEPLTGRGGREGSSGEAKARCCPEGFRFGRTGRCCASRGFGGDQRGGGGKKINQRERNIWLCRVVENVRLMFDDGADLRDVLVRSERHPCGTQ